VRCTQISSPELKQRVHVTVESEYISSTSRSVTTLSSSSSSVSVFVFASGSSTGIGLKVRAGTDCVSGYRETGGALDMKEHLMERRWHCRQDSRMGVGDVEREAELEDAGGVVGGVDSCGILTLEGEVDSVIECSLVWSCVVGIAI